MKDLSTNLQDFPKKRRIWPFVLIALVVLILLGIFLAGVSVFRAAKTLMHLPAEDFKIVSSHLMPDYESLSFSPPNSELQLNAWYFASEEPFRGNLVFVHNNRANKLQYDLETSKLYNFFLDQGFNVLAIDLRHCGLSQGDSCSYGYAEYRDILGALETMQRVSGRKDFILYGIGTGVTASILAWQELPAEIAESDLREAKNPEALISRKDIKGFILDTPSASPYDYIRADLKHDSFLQKNLYAKYIPKLVRISSGGPEVENLIPLLAHIEVPIMITRNIPDSKIRQESIDAFISECVRLKSESVFISETPQKGHLEGFSLEPEKYLEDLEYFINIYF